ncbi:DUF4221 family protein [Belliella marina]|uniref:DUF4221 family protein n=1 Tax=Belliella marina TaxID=1644146 RepID=A0ABW4VKF6_9BACT
MAVSILFSCGTKADKTIDEPENFNLQIDTVLINSKDQSLFLSWNLSNAGISTDNRYLYNLNVSEPSLEKIDLDQLSFVEKVKLEKEGPDGIGNNGRGGIVSLDENLILFKGYPAPIVMTTEGKKTDVLKELTIAKKKFSDLGKDLLYEQVDPNNFNMVYGILLKFPGLEHELAILNLHTNDTSRLKLPEWKMLGDFSLICNNTDIMMFMNPEYF